MATVLMTCTNPLCRFRFPVNLKKHLYRRERFCPRCHTEITVRQRFSFRPNPKWTQQKLKQQADRAWAEEIRKRKGGEPAIALPAYHPARIPDGLLALSMLLKRQAESEKEKEK